MKKFILVLSVLSFFSVQLSFASLPELYGYGATSSAMGNTMLPSSTSGFGTFYNPAMNGANNDFLRLNWALQYAHPKFLPIQNITVANTATGSTTGVQGGNALTDDYLDTFVQEVAFSMNFGEKLKYLTVGATADMPVSRVAYLDTGEEFRPEYFQYRSRTQRPQIYASVSATPFEHFHLGAGIAFATNLSALATVNVSAQQSTPGGAVALSYARFSSTIKPGAAPYFSVYSDPDPYQFGATVRLPNRYKVDLDTTASASLFTGSGQLPLHMDLTSSLFYDPLEIDAAAAIKLSHKTLVTVELDWIQYSHFESPALSVSDEGSVTPLQPSISDLPPMRDLFIPKVGVQREYNITTWRAGYFYRPSPVKDNSGIGNLIDPAQHVFTVGVGFDLKKAKLTDKNITVDLNAQYHWLIHQSITKSSGGDEAGNPGTKIGAPGYDIGGSIIAGGLAINVTI